MQDKEFNLLEEPWIKVLTGDLEVKEVSLKELFHSAQEYKCLAGEISTMDAAILRFLLSIVMTVFYRYDVDGKADELSEENDSDPEDVLARWKHYWDKGSFNAELFEQYLEKYQERFWLFHPETPFYQVPDLAYGTNYNINSLIADLKESNNSATKHHFSMEERTEISASEAARWLIHLNAYAVNIKADKKAPGTKNSVGTGRLGRQGLLIAQSDNLFHILMLNLTALRDGKSLWSLPHPTWEMKVSAEQGREIASPRNLPEAYTIQSRRILLKRENGMVVGFRAIGGDYCILDNAFYEQMTIWRKKEDKKTKLVSFSPATFKSEVQAWREFPTIFNVREMEHIPGIIQWGQVLCRERYLSDQQKISFQTIGLEYGDGMSYTYGNIISDSITLSNSLLEQLDGSWNERITDEVAKCKEISNKLFYGLSDNIVKLYFGKNDNKRGKIQSQLSEQYYAALDQPFRAWLSQLDSVNMEKEDIIFIWEKRAYHIARQVVENYIMTLAGKGYEIKEDGNYTLFLPKIFNTYLWQLKKLYKEIASEERRAQ